MDEMRKQVRVFLKISSVIDSWGAIENNMILHGIEFS